MFNACLLTSSGEVQRVIEDLGELDDDESEESDDSSDEEEEEEEEENNDDRNKFPSLEKIISNLKIFMALKKTKTYF